MTGTSSVLLNSLAFTFIPVHSFFFTDDIIAKVRSVLEQYKGTHNFHNFTSGKYVHQLKVTNSTLEVLMNVLVEH